MISGHFTVSWCESCLFFKVSSVGFTYFCQKTHKPFTLTSVCCLPCDWDTSRSWFIVIRTYVFFFYMPENLTYCALDCFSWYYNATGFHWSLCGIHRSLQNSQKSLIELFCWNLLWFKQAKGKTPLKVGKVPIKRNSCMSPNRFLGNKAIYNYSTI